MSGVLKDKKGEINMVEKETVRLTSLSTKGG